MRKSSRILSILLVACMLISAMVVAVSAAISTTAPKPDGATGSITPKTYTMSSTGNASNSIYACATTGANSISNKTHDGASHGTTCPNGGILFAAEDFIKPGGYKYATVDFDIMSDGYLKTEGDVISVDKEATSGKLAYRENIHISALLGGYTHFAYFVSNGDNWYLSADGAYSEDDVALATEKGAWNHVTMVDDGANVYVYLDGEFVAKKATSLSGKTYCRIGIDVSGIAKEDALKTGYSIKVGNVVANKYSADYASGEAYGIDDYMTAADFKAPLYNCADVVYGANYIYDKDVVAGQDAVTVTYADKTVENYQNLAAFELALSKMSVDKLNGARIETRKNIKALDLPDAIPSITVVATNGAKVSLVMGANYIAPSTSDGQGTTIYTLKPIPSPMDQIDGSKINSGITNYKKHEFTEKKNPFVLSNGIGNFADQDYAKETGADGTVNDYLYIRNKVDAKAPTSNSLYPYFGHNDKNDVVTINYSEIAYYVADFDVSNIVLDSPLTYVRFGGYGSNYTFFAYILPSADRTSYYLSTDSTLDENDVMLANADGVWNHITYVVVPGEFYLFLDGEFVGKGTHSQTNINRFSINFGGMSKTAFNMNFNLHIDNVSINTYAKGYTDGDDIANNSIVDYLGTDANKPANLKDCADVVYTDFYLYRAAEERQNAVVIELADGTKTTYGLADVDAGIAAIEALTKDQLATAKVFLRKGVLDTDKLPAGVEDLKIFADGSAEVTGGTNYRLRMLKADGNAKCYVIDCLTVAGEGITNVGVITAGKPIVSDHNNGTIGYGYGNKNGFNNSMTVGSNQTVIRDGIINEYQQIMNDGTHADVNTGGKFLNNNSQIWFGINDVKLSDNKYITVDFDFASDKYLVDGALSDTGSELAYVNKMNLMLFHASNVASNLYIINNNGAWYASADQNYDANDVPLAKEAGVWNHFTYVMSESGKIYVFVDGKFVTSYSRNNSETIRRIVVGTNGCAYTAFSYALDNVSVNKYALGGEYGLDAFLANDTYKTTDLYEVDDVVYNRDYKYYGFVDGQYVASVTDKTGNKDNFFFLEDALENVADGVTLESRVNVPAIDPEDTIMSYSVVTKFGATMAKPSDKYYKISKSTSGTTTTYVLTRVGEDELVIVNFEIYGDEYLIFSEQSSDVKGSVFSLSDEFLAALADLMEYTKGEYKWMIDMGEGFVFVDECLVPGDYANEEVTVRISAISVTWLNGAGEEVDVEAWFAGNEILPYNIAPLSDRVVTGNGWYDMDYTTWETDGKDMLNNKFVAAALTPMVFKAKMTPVPAVADIKLNMSLLTKFEANLYITNRPLENIKLGGIFSDAELTLDMIADLELAELNGNTYFLDNFFFDNSDVDKVVSRYVQYTVNYEGGEITLVDEIQVSLLDYAQKVLAQYGCGSEEANLAYNLINYANAAYALKNGADYDDAVTFLALEGHEDCACKNTYAYVGDEVYYNENTLGENVLGWSFDVSNEQPAFVIYVMIDEFDNALVEDIEFAFFGINGTEVSDIAVKLVRGENIEIDGVVYATFFFEDMPLYNAAEMFTITVTDATTGEVYVTNCNLATYIDYAIWTEMDAAALKVAEALYSFAKVAKDYKLN